MLDGCSAKSKICRLRSLAMSNFVVLFRRPVGVLAHQLVPCVPAFGERREDVLTLATGRGHWPVLAEAWDKPSDLTAEGRLVRLALDADSVGVRDIVVNHAPAAD